MSTNVYPETLSSAIDLGIKEALPKGYFAGEFSCDPMSYETSQTIQVPILADPLNPPRKIRHGIRLSLYRMPSGRYEVTAYAH